MKNFKVYYVFLVCMAIASLIGTRMYANETEDASKSAFGGCEIHDPTSVVADGSYISFSTVYNGRRYYLGVDTVQARLGKDTVTYYEGANYATLWVAGPNWSATCTTLTNKDYTRTVKSVWLAEQVNRERYLALGKGGGTYNTLRLLATGTMWHTEKDDRERNRYIQGFLYYYSPASETGVDVYRYLRYDPVYGFSRLYEAKPANSQRISVWDRKTGSDLIYNMTPSTIVYGYDVTHDTVKQPITSQVIYYEDVDRFRSRYDYIDVFARRSEPITNQSTLIGPPYNLSGHYEWKSNPIDEAHPELYNGLSKMQYYTLIEDNTDPEHPVMTWGWADTTMVWARKDGFKLENNVWYDTIYAIGKSPIDNPANDIRFLRKPAGGGAPTEGDYVNHSDVLYTHFTCKDKEYRDSVNVTRQVFHKDYSTTLTTQSYIDAAPIDDYSFPYTYNNKNVSGDAIVSTDTACTFTISGNYETGHVVRGAGGNVVDKYIGERGSVNIANSKCYRDTIWSDDPTPVMTDIVLYDTLLVEALDMDGTPCTWIESIRLTARNQIRVKVQQYNPDALENRRAQIRYTYRYRHSSAAGDQVTDSRVILIVQEWRGAHDDEMYSFVHKEPFDNDRLQAVHEKHNVVYAIPEEPLSLPLHRDHWGYYRWFNYDDTNRDRDVQYGSAWTYAEQPKNKQNANFMNINLTSSSASRGRWDMIDFNPAHFTQWERTVVPAVSYPASNSKTGKIACDVSANYDIQTEGTIGTSSLNSLTEPTLGYRQIFDIRPAKWRADTLATVRGNGSGANWLENYKIVVPAGRAFTIQPNCPIDADGSEEIDEEHLQYIYYFNPTGSPKDANMGTKNADYADNKAICYGRIGKKKQTGDPLYHARLIPASELLSMPQNDTMTVFMINPRRNGGYMFGADEDKKKKYKEDILNGDDLDTAALRQNIETLLNNPLSEYGYYIHKLTKTDNGDTKKIKITSRTTGTDLCAHSSLLGLGAGVDWSNTTLIGKASTDITVTSYSSTSSDRVSDIDPALVKLYMFNRYIASTYYGYMTAYTMTRRTILSPYEYNKAEVHLDDLGDDDAGGSNTINQGWCFFEIIEPKEIEEHFETPRWEKSADGRTWNPADSVAVWDYKTNTATCKQGYSMSADGALHIGAGVHTAVNTPIFYRLRTEHFQIAKFVGLTRNADTEMLKQGDIISEEEVESDYNIIYSLDMEHWRAPGTNDVVAYNQPFPWDFTELSYHHPLSVVPADKRVFNTEMPGKGEYAFINKFVVPEGPTTDNDGEEFECMAGADHGYMLCVNAAGKRATIMNFDFNQLTCSDQQIYLVGNYCNPVNNTYEPEITADMEGSFDGKNWTRIYRYKSGKIPYKAHDDPNGHWYQMALPIARDSIDKYTYFRCRAEISGGSQHNAHLLIDRLRFIEKARGFTVFQNKATCMRDDSVTALIRLDFATDTLYRPGKLVAYQLQRWNNTLNGGKGGYEPMPYAQVMPGYVKDGFTVAEGPNLKTSQGNDYGYVYVPERNYNPENSASTPSALRVALVTQAADSLIKWGLLPAANKDARINTFKDETGNVRSFEDVISADNLYDGATPHIKSYVKEGNKWVVYVTCRLKVSDTQNNTFRVGMTLMKNLSDKPTFTEDHCATFHVFKVKQRTALRIDDKPWVNATRTQVEAADTLLKANETYRTNVALEVDEAIQGHTPHNPRCKFDFLHSSEDVRPDNPAGNAAFLAKYGCTRAEFIDAMETFRHDDENNTIRDEYEWAKVKPDDFTWSGRSMEQATAIYNRLNKLINDGVLEIGLDYRDIYMGDKADSYFYLIPVPASGRVDLHNGNIAGDADTTVHVSVCNDTLWLELHSKQPTAKLRFGYDSRVGDTYIVPTIRASRSEANSNLDVRVAHMSTEGDTYALVLGWEKTELIGSNDPAWTGMQKFNYTQDKDMRGQTPSAFDYYTTGSVIQYTPAAGNDIALKAGYWYEFKVPFYAVPKSSLYETDPAEVTGHSQFILAIAPDTVRWTPAHPDAANYWNDDHNWTPVMQHVPEDGFKATVPMKDTKVIITEVEEGLAPIASDVVENQMDTLHYGYEKNTCNAILFKPNAEILGQEKLTYERAYVDIQLKTGSWQTFSPALDDIYSGDMYIPFSTSYNPSNPASGASTDTTDFAPKTFPCKSEYSGTYNPRVYPFAFYQGFYNSSVPVAFYNTDKEGTPVNTTTVQSKSSVDWVKTNALDMYYAPGKASVLNGYDATDEDDRSIVVRLPKPDDAYHGFGKNGGADYVAGPAVTISRPNKMNRNLAYDKYAPSFSETDGLTYTLTNETESEIFFFGNPTMSLIDVYRLCVANQDVLKYEAGSYSFTAYNLIDGDNYTVRTITGPGQFFVAPQRAVGLIANAAQTAAKSLPIKLTPSALVAITGDGHFVSGDETAKPMPRRASHAAETVNQRRLYIAAANETDWGIKKAYLTLGEQENATRGYRYGEDALSIASGLNYFSDESYTTPLSMYTIAEKEALMQDIRDTLKCVPLVFSTMDDNYEYSAYTLLSFAMDGNWTEAIYLSDALTGDSIRIVNGLQIAIETPMSDQLRYYINGKQNPSNENQQGITTDASVEDEDKEQAAITTDKSNTTIYDVLGRRLMTLGEFDLISNIKLPAGVYIIVRGDKTERIVIK